MPGGSPDAWESSLQGEEIAARYGVGALDAEVIGRAPGAPLRLIKYLWHILVVLGRPAC